MSKTTLCSIFLILFFISAGVPRVSAYKQPLVKEGVVIIYLQPIPREAHMFSFSIAGISALRDDGTGFPLLMTLKDVKGAKHAGVQKRLASGVVPPGPYKGLSISFSRASLLGDEGETSLLVSKETVIVKQGFDVLKGKALALFLTLNVPKSIKSGFSFDPVFSLMSYGRELRNLIGYVSNSDSNIISLFNKRTMQVISVIATGMRPSDMALDQRNGRVYVAVSESSAIEIVDVFSGRITGRIRLNFGDEPRELAMTPDGRTIVSANYGSNTASIIDAVSRFEVSRVRVGEGPVSAVVDPSGKRAYIINSVSNTLSVIDLSRKKISATIAIEETPLRAAFNRTGDRLYVITRDSPNLVVVDPLKFTVIEKIFIGTGALSVKVDTRSGLVYVGMKTGVVSVVDPSSLILIDTINVGGSAGFITIDDEENAIFVLLPDRGSLQKVNLVSKKLIGEIDVEKGAYAVSVMGER